MLPQVGARAQQALSVVPALVLGGAIQQEVIGQQVVVKGVVGAQGEQAAEGGAIQRQVAPAALLVPAQAAHCLGRKVALRAHGQPSVEVARVLAGVLLW
jgi:hypothetical protein